MISTKKIVIATTVLFALSIYSVALADTTAPTQNSASQEIQSDSQVTAQDLGVQNPTILPNSPFYFIKEWGRGIANFFTFNATKKAELANTYANEKLIELQKLADSNASAQDIKDAVTNYQNSINDLKNKISQVQDKSTNNQELTNFLTDFAKQQILQEKALRTMITDQVSADISNIVKNAEDTQIKNFGAVVSDLQQAKQDIKTQIMDGLKAIPGSQLKDFSNLELLNNIKQNVSDATKQAIQSVTATVQQSLQNSLKNLPAIEQQKVQDYLQNIPGDKTIYNNIVKDIAPEMNSMPQLAKTLMETEQSLQTSITNSVNENMKNLQQNLQQNIQKDVQDNVQKTINDAQNQVQNQIQQNLQQNLTPQTTDPGGKE